MITTKIQEHYIFRHNEDYSGSVNIANMLGFVDIPFEVLLEFVAGWVRESRVSEYKEHLSQISLDELFGMFGNESALAGDKAPPPSGDEFYSERKVPYRVKVTGGSESIVNVGGDGTFKEKE